MYTAASRSDQQKFKCPIKCATRNNHRIGKNKGGHRETPRVSERDDRTDMETDKCRTYRRHILSLSIAKYSQITHSFACHHFFFGLAICVCVVRFSFFFFCDCFRLCHSHAMKWRRSCHWPNKTLNLKFKYTRIALRHTHAHIGTGTQAA